jgi:hypothetical protein
MVTAIAAGNGILPVFIDLNRTHATNPLWLGHARFHLVQQVGTLALAAAVEVGLLWWPGPGMALRFYLAAGLVATSLAGFLLAVVTRRFYGGTLHDPNGMKPVKIQTSRGVVEVNVNVPIVVTATVVLAGAVWLYWRSA